MKLRILKGCHFSNFIPSIKIAKEWLRIREAFIFDESCRYQVAEDSCVNKLFGFSFGLLGVHKNSVRFGWVYDRETDKISLLRYVYKNGSLRKSVLKSVGFNEEFNILFEFGRYITGGWEILMYINDELVSVESFDDKVSKLIFTLGFYFGGKSRAPHTMHIQSKKL